MTSTQQNEASQAVRLLYKYAVKGSEGHEPEALYQARVLLEGFIKSAGVLESTDSKVGIELSAFIDGTRWHFGDTVKLRSGVIGVITGINSQEKRFKVLPVDQSKTINAYIENVSKVEADE